MTCNNLPHVYFSKFTRVVLFLDWQEVRRFCQSVYNYPNCIMALGRLWQFRYEVHGNLFPFPLGYYMLLQETYRLLVLGFNLGAS